MTAYVALIRAVNVSGTGLLPMAKLRAMAEECGFERIRTLGASGNLLFDSKLGETAVAKKLEQQLEGFFGRSAPVMVRSAKEMRAIAVDNPFADEKGSRNFVFFLPGPPPEGVMDTVRGQQDERIALGKREIYVAYGEGIGKTKLVIPAAKAGTARNRNTVEKLADKLEEPA